MTLTELWNDHFLERVGYYRTSWIPTRYVFVASRPQGTINHRWLVQEPRNHQWVNYYLTPDEGNATDWDYISVEAMKNYQLLQGLTYEEPEEVL